MESKQLYLFIVSISIALIEENSLIGTCIKRDECLSPFSMEIEGREEGDGVVDIQQADLMTKEQELDVLKRVLCQTHFEMTTMKLRAEAIQQELLSQDNPNLTNVLDFINDFFVSSIAYTKYSSFKQYDSFNSRIPAKIRTCRGFTISDRRTRTECRYTAFCCG